MNVQALGWTLLHFLWQGAAVAALLASFDLLLRRAAPQVRYLLASAALLVMALLPAATFLLVQGTPPSREPSSVAAVRAETARPPSGSGAAWTAFAAGENPAGPGRLRSWVEPAMPAIVVFWGGGVLLLSLRTLGGWGLAQRLKRAGLAAAPAEVQSVLERLVGRLRVSAPVRMFESALVEVPTVVGWLRPVLLLPASALTGLSPQQLELILAHELAHVRRHDYFVNLVQTAVETVLFYHPAVWWVSHRMRVERENCCDDMAVAACGNAAVYARALADLEERRSRRPVLAVAASGGSLLDRVKRLAGPPPDLSRSSRGLAALLAMVALSVAAGAGSLLLAQDAPPVAAKPVPLEDLELAEADVPLPLVPEPGGPEEPEEPVVPGEPGEPEEIDPVLAGVPEYPEDLADLKAPEVPEGPCPDGGPPVPDAPPAPPAEGRAFPLEHVLEMAQHGVTPEWIAAMAAAGYPSLTAEQLVELRAQGVGPAYVRGLAKEGYRKLSTARLMALRAQGVTPAFLRGLKEQGFNGISPMDAVQLRALGVTPSFIRELREAGQRDLSMGRAMALRSSGVDGRYVSSLKALGYGNLTTARLMALRSQGVTPQYVQGLAGLGYRGLSTGVLLALRAQGVTAEYVRELKQAGLADLSAGALIALRAQGVDGAFVREMKKAGFEPLTAEKLIERRAQGTPRSWSWRKRPRGGRL